LKQNLHFFRIQQQKSFQKVPDIGIKAGRLSARSISQLMLNLRAILMRGMQELWNWDALTLDTEKKELEKIIINVMGEFESNEIILFKY
jgi:hypothetical protein